VKGVHLSSPRRTTARAPRPTRACRGIEDDCRRNSRVPVRGQAARSPATSLAHRARPRDAEQTAFCAGIENYSAHLDGRKAGERPYTLLDYFPEDYPS